MDEVMSKGLVLLEGSILPFRPGTLIPAKWQRDHPLCAEYRHRFGAPVSLPFWFVNGMDIAAALIQESLVRGRRRWILECGPWGGNPPIETFAPRLIQAGRSLDSLALIETRHLWLDPVEWLETELPVLQSREPGRSGSTE